MSHRVFLHGILCDAALLARIVKGSLTGRQARLANVALRYSPKQDFAHLVPRAGDTAEGILAEADKAAFASLEFFFRVFGCAFQEGNVETGEGTVSAKIAFPRPNREIPVDDWNLGDWQENLAPAAREAAEEIMRLKHTHSAEDVAGILTQIRMRASSRVRAQSHPTPDLFSPSMSLKSLDLLETRQPYTDYFAVREDDMRFPKFGEGMSAQVTRATFLGGDAVTVLPYDPVSDSVLVIRQFRHGVFARGDLQPWLIEPAAGRIDPNEEPETTALRELREETGVDGGELHLVAQYYPSPSAYSEYIFSYVAVTDLSGRDGETSGLDSEDEDIMSHVIPFDRLIELVELGAANTAPLVLSAFWLLRHRERLRSPD